MRSSSILLCAKLDYKPAIFSGQFFSILLNYITIEQAIAPIVFHTPLWRWSCAEAHSATAHLWGSSFKFNSICSEVPRPSVVFIYIRIWIRIFLQLFLQKWIGCCQNQVKLLQEIWNLFLTCASFPYLKACTDGTSTWLQGKGSPCNFQCFHRKQLYSKEFFMPACVCAPLLLSEWSCASGEEYTPTCICLYLQKVLRVSYTTSSKRNFTLCQENNRQNVTATQHVCCVTPF